MVMDIVGEIVVGDVKNGKWIWLRLRFEVVFKENVESVLGLRRKDFWLFPVKIQNCFFPIIYLLDCLNVFVSVRS